MMTGKLFEVREGEIYENIGGGQYLAKSSGNTAFMLNINCGWFFIAHRIRIHEDGRIDWLFSSKGQFIRDYMEVHDEQ